MEGKLGTRCPRPAASQPPPPLSFRALSQRRQCVRDARPSATPPLPTGGAAASAVTGTRVPATALVPQLLQLGAPPADVLPSEVPDLEVDIVGAAWHLGESMQRRTRCLWLRCQSTWQCGAGVLRGCLGGGGGGWGGGWGGAIMLQILGLGAACSPASLLCSVAAMRSQLVPAPAKLRPAASLPCC